MSQFFQDGPVLGNQYADDQTLQTFLSRHVPAEMLADIEADLSRFADRLLGDIGEMAADAEAHEPRLVQYDPWGRRIDYIETARGWQQLDRVSAEEGLVAIGYQRQQGSLSRLYQFAKLYLFNPSSAIYTCPLAMTDGAARAIEVHGDEALRRGALARLTSRDPDQFWTSGQWMTERTGGSDVGRTETIAQRDGDMYRLYGTKWFTSATTAQMAMTLARIVDDQGRAIEGSRGLSLFYLETRDADGNLNHIVVHRLKEKLGTRALPTAELSLEAAPARLVGEPGRGVANIAALFNVTRVYNAVSSVASMRRALALCRDYAARRTAFGKRLAEHPLHVETLADLEVEYQAAFHLVFHSLLLMGRDECGEASEDEAAVFRLLTPVIKLYTARQCVAAMSETLEAFGGAGYVEDTGLPKLLRDAQVLPIWEGTTNVLSLDCLRAIEREQALPPYLAHLRGLMAGVDHPELAAAIARVEAAASRLEAYLPDLLSAGKAAIEAGARRFAFGLARTMAAALLIEHAQWSAEQGDGRREIAVAQRWCTRDLAPLIDVDALHLEHSAALGLDMPLPDSTVTKQAAPRAASPATA